MERVKKIKLRNGTTIILDKIQNRESVAIGVFSRQGSRTEFKPGITHFLEHMLFKGTHRRTGYEITSEIENKGGYLDADTTHDYIGIYARVLRKDFEVAFDVIGDMVSFPLFDERAVETERQVVIEEYLGYLENPEDLATSLLYEALFPDHPLGREIIGNEDSINSFRREDLIRRWKEVFCYDALLLVIVGDVDINRIIELYGEKFSLEGSCSGSFEEPNFKNPLPLNYRIRPHLNQIHINMGIRVPSLKDKKWRASMIVLNSILGGGMSSRLNVKIREELGLAYSVSSYLEFYRDVGVFGVFIGTSKNSSEGVVNLIRDEIEDIRKNGIREDELLKSIEKIEGSTIMSLESLSSRLFHYATFELLVEEVLSIEEYLREIRGVKRDEIWDFCNDFLNPDDFSYGIILPQEDNFIQRLRGGNGHGGKWFN